MMMYPHIIYISTSQEKHLAAPVVHKYLDKSDFVFSDVIRFFSFKGGVQRSAGPSTEGAQELSNWRLSIDIISDAFPPPKKKKKKKKTGNKLYKPILRYGQLKLA